MNGAKWQLLNRFTLQPVQFLFGIILARLISPHEMGILGLTAFFFAIAEQLQICGFGSALIRKQNRTNEDINTVFWFNVGMSALLSSILFFSAPLFATFFNEPALINLTRVSALMMFFRSTVSVHYTLYSAARNFKTPAVIGIISTILPMPFTVWAAYEGWSYWAPMMQGVLSGLMSLSIVWIVSPWRPSFIFSVKSLKEFFGFSSKLTLTGLITTIYSQLRTFIIGKFYSPTELALFSRGYTTCSTPLNVIQQVLSNVLYPILSTIQDDQDYLISIYRKYIRLTALVVEGGMITMAANIHSFIVSLYGENWASCAFYAQLLCFGIMLDPLSNINSNLYVVLGRTDIALKKESLLRIFGISAMIIGALYSVTGVCIAAALTGMFAFILSLYLTTGICKLTISEQLKDFFPYIIISFISNIPAFLINYLYINNILHINVWINLLMGISCSLLLYIFILYIKKDSAGKFLLSLITEQIKLKK